MSGAELYLISAVVGAGTTIMTSNAQARQLEGQAHQAKLKGRIDNLNYKRQGVQILKETNKVIAANVARASSGGLDPYKSGEAPDMISGYGLRMGINDFTIARDNATIAKRMGEYESASLMQAAKTTRKVGMMTAIAQVGMGVSGYAQLGGPGGSAMASSTSNKFLNPMYSDFGKTGVVGKTITGQMAYKRFLPGVR
tara:strand:- start:3855 stop:4445 length:591 start_codon:yes stop_codon:yes gene_type:complete